MPRYTAIYNAYLSFVIPKTVGEYLLEDDDARNDGKTVGSWWIRYGTFYYLDKDGNRQEIEHESAPDVDYKEPSGDTMIEDCDDGEDEE
jgi:hypothetical protein